jgi:hypothetical protein
VTSSAAIASSEFRTLIADRREEILTEWVKEQLKEGRGGAR